MLSNLEQAKVLDAEWILTKHQIMEKAQLLMQQQIAIIKETFSPLQPQLDAGLLAAVPKISKGENYKKLPYIILDYPAVFSKQDVFALRTMFWWGHNFSIHLLLSGIYLEKFGEVILRNAKKSAAQLYICVYETEWEHHFEPPNYILVRGEIIEMMQQQNAGFIKLALKFNLKEWNNLPELLPVAYKEMLNLFLD